MTTNPTPTETAHVVVGVDGSPTSKEALIWAVRYADLIGARVDAVAAWHYPISAGMSAMPIVTDAEQDAQTLLADTVAATLGVRLPANVTLIVREGAAAQVLLAESKGAELLVVGSRGHGGFSGLLLGSVSSHCAEHATCPVLVFHG